MTSGPAAGLKSGPTDGVKIGPTDGGGSTAASESVGSGAGAPGDKARRIRWSDEKDDDADGGPRMAAARPVTYIHLRAH